MSTITAPTKESSTKSRKLVEMNWDPITRIVGSLGIFTKIDFENLGRSPSAIALRRYFVAIASS